MLIERHAARTFHALRTHADHILPSLTASAAVLFHAPQPDLPRRPTAPNQALRQLLPRNVSPPRTHPHRRSHPHRLNARRTLRAKAGATAESYILSGEARPPTDIVGRVRTRVSPVRTGPHDQRGSMAIIRTRERATSCAAEKRTWSATGTCTGRTRVRRRRGSMGNDASAGTCTRNGRVDVIYDLE